MIRSGPRTIISDLRRALERVVRQGSRELAALPFGISELDAKLPGGGLSLGHLHEVIEGGAAGEYAGLAALFTAGILARHPGPVLWCLRGRDLFAPALARVGLHPDRIIYCETWKDAEVLPAMEEGLRCKGLAGVVGEVTRLPLNASRRLQLCAGQDWRHRDGHTPLANTTEKNMAGEPNAAATRWRVSPIPHPPPDSTGCRARTGRSICCASGVASRILG